MIPFIDLQAQRARIADKIDAAVLKVVASGAYIFGPQVKEFEQKLAAFGQAKHCLANANGTDALALPLMAWGVGPGDAVFTPSFTFAATAEVVPWFGATPVFVDVLPDTYNMDPASLEAAIEGVKKQGKLTPRVVIAVDLFGQPADYPKIAEICRKHGLKLISDSAQGFGCTLHGKHPLNWADVTTASFFPAKPLGCYGDGGATLTNDEAFDKLMRSLAFHGASNNDKYNCDKIGMNSRLDTIQAAILLEKLAIYEDEIRVRNEVAKRYTAMLSNLVRTPRVIEGGVSNWAQYTIEVENRDAFAAHMREAGVPTAQYYPKPLHRQGAYAEFPVGDGGLGVSDDICHRVISLPMHAYLDAPTQEMIAGAVSKFVNAGS